MAAIIKRTIKLIIAILRFFVRISFEVTVAIIYRLFGLNKAPPRKPARVFKIWYRSRPLEIGVAAKDNFWCIHSHWDSAEAILAEGVSLYSLNEEYAYFVKTPPTTNLLDAHAFYYSAQYASATHLIQVPIVEFHRMAQQVGDPKGDVVFLFSTGRCGSTLLQQMMSVFPQTASISEPDSFTCAHAMKNAGVSPVVLKTVLQSIVRLEGKRCVQGSCLVIKTRSQCTWQAQMISELFPNIRFLFMYRNAIDVTFSNIRAFLHLPGLGIAFNESIPYAIRDKLATPVKNFVAKGAAHIYAEDYLKSLPPLPLMATGWVVEVLRYAELRQNGVEIAGVRYEDLLANPEGTIRAIAEHIGMPVTSVIVKDSLEEMKKDSQAKSDIGTSSQAKITFTDKDRQILLDLLARKNL